MARDYQTLVAELKAQPKRWLVTGAAGFIGSNLCLRLLELGQQVLGFDNFLTGKPANVAEVRTAGGARFSFSEGDIRDLAACRQAAAGIDYVLHQAALGSVPRSIEDPALSLGVNVDGFLNMLLAARDAKVKCFVYASSSSVYGDAAESPKVEERIGEALSPYAVSKRVNELQAAVFARCYAMQCRGLRYFNVFGPRQDPEGAYAAVIPRWIGKLLAGEACTIYGDGKTTRDFCYIENVMQANILAAVSGAEPGPHSVYNIACGEASSLNELYQAITAELSGLLPERSLPALAYEAFREGDIRHSLASIEKAQRDLGYMPVVKFAEGVAATVRFAVSPQ